MNREDVAVAAATGDPLSFDRRWLLRAGAVSVGVALAGGILGPFRSAVAGLTGDPGGTQRQLDVQIFQTAASLENVALEAYATALALPVVGANATLVHFLESARSHHIEHRDAFNAQAEALGGVRQEAPNPTYDKLVEEALPTLDDVGAVVGLAATLEEAAGDTYLANVTQLADPQARALMAAVMGVEAQHLAVLRIVAALLAADLPDLVAVPTDVARLPSAIGSVASPGPFEAPEHASPPEQGAVR
jgi:hypothetical protein